MDLEKFLEKYKVQIGIGLVGLIIFGVGLIFLRAGQESPKVEIISSEEPAKKIFVDLQGAVEKPGVYELSGDARINDLLIQAGGLSAQADREWVSKNINLAQKLTDGIKIYIPTQKEVRQFGGPALSITSNGGEVAGATNKININTASQSQLESLWGIGEVRAKNIIANRPYQSIEEIATKAKIPKNVFERIKEQITVY